MNCYPGHARIYSPPFTTANLVGIIVYHAVGKYLDISSRDCHDGHCCTIATQCVLGGYCTYT